MCDPVTLTAVAAVTTAGYTVYSGEKARHEQKKQQKRADQQLAAEKAQATQEANQQVRNATYTQAAKSPTDLIQQSILNRRKRGVISTARTGARGVAAGLLNTATPSLLGS